MQYVYTQGEHEVTAAPHGNAKSGESYVRTMPSVMTKLKTASSKMCAKRALSFVASGAGGIVGAKSAGCLPRNRQQAKDMRRKNEGRDHDPLYSVMLMCKESEGKRNQDAYVRLVNAAPFPMMVLTFDWTLDDLVRFCTDPNQSSIVGVDPTFSLGAFEVTVTTYTHLMLRRKDDASKIPTMIGPLFVHLKKDFAAFHFFASALVGKRPELANVQSFGSDGEAALVNALVNAFSTRPSTFVAFCISEVTLKSSFGIEISQKRCLAQSCMTYLEVLHIWSLVLSMLIARLCLTVCLQALKKCGMKEKLLSIALLLSTPGLGGTVGTFLRPPCSDPFVKRQD